MRANTASTIPPFAHAFGRHVVLALLLMAATQPAAALTWTDWADLTLASPGVMIATVEKTGKLSRKTAPDVPPGEIRALIEARLNAVLKAPAILPARGEWLWQGAPDAKGRPPFAKQAAVIAFADPVSGSTNPEVQQYRLTKPQAMQPWSADAEATIRAILAEAAKPDSRGLMVTQVSDGFHSVGTVDGQSESQFFLATESGRPMTLLVERTPGAAPVVKLATGEVIDGAGPVKPQTLRWRALACGLPAALPERLAEIQGLQADYAAARQQLGPCGRTMR